jgi:pSer/pThr/pTyr-binding forkhead associated (FHA) protein
MSTTKRVLRAIAGLPPGTTFLVDGRMRLGRAPDSDIQLMDAGVSRHHARVELDETGIVMLSDLSSRAGTTVDGVSVDRVVLEHGSVIMIGSFAFRFEVSVEPITLRRSPPRRAGIEALRVTADHGPARRRTADVPAARAAERAVTIVPDEGAPPVTALVRAIQGLRAGEVRARATDGLEARLLQSEREPGRRRHRRFACETQAWLARADGTRIATSPVDVIDLSAGGAQVSWRGEGVAMDGEQWLVVDLDVDDDEPIVVMRAKVAWSRPDVRAAGLEFVGGARRGLDAHELVRADLGP